MSDNVCITERERFSIVRGDDWYRSEVVDKKAGVRARRAGATEQKLGSLGVDHHLVTTSIRTCSNSTHKVFPVLACTSLLATCPPSN